MKRIAWLLCWCLQLAVSQAQVQDFEAERKEGRALLLAGLEEHSDWLLAQKLLGTRLVLLEQILEVQPDHEAARRSLGYKPRRTGGWTPPDKPKRSSDKNPRGLKQEPERRKAALSAFFEHHLRLLERCGGDLDRREWLRADISIVDPNNAEMHALLGEVQVGQSWQLHEVVRAKETRATMAKLLKAAQREKPKPVEATPADAAFGLPWTGMLEFPLGRLRGSVPLPELETCAAQLQGVLALYRMFADPEAQAPAGYGVSLMQDAKQGRLFLAGLEYLEDAEREAFLPQKSLYYHRTNQSGHWSTQSPERLDAAARLLIQKLLASGPKVTLESPWLHEGFGMYWTHELTGTRLTWYLPCNDPPDWKGELSCRTEMLFAKDWRKLGARLLDHPRRPKLADLVKAKPADFHSVELLYANLLAAFLCEAYPQQTGLILRDVASGSPAALVLERKLGLSMEALDLRLVLWLKQYAGEPEQGQEE